MIAVVEQDGDLGNIHGLRAEIVHVLCQHLQEPRIIRHIRLCAVGKEREAQGIDRQMPFDAIGGFVEAKTFRLDTGITGILNCL